MPIHHFHIHDDVAGTLQDETGTGLSDVVAAEREAVHLAGSVIADNAKINRHAAKWQLEVTDRAGMTLLSLDFAVRRTDTTSMAP